MSDHTIVIILVMKIFFVQFFCGEELPPRQRSGVAAERSNPTSKERWLCRRKRAERSYSMFKVRRGAHEEIHLVQSKRNPSKMVGVVRGHQRAVTLKP